MQAAPSISRRRVYETWPSETRFYCWGLLVSGPDRGYFYFSLTTLIVLAALFWGLSYVSLSVSRLSTVSFPVHSCWSDRVRGVEYRPCLYSLALPCAPRSSLSSVPFLIKNLGIWVVVVSVWLTAFCLLGLLLATFSDPGILPRSNVDALYDTKSRSQVASLSFVARSRSLSTSLLPSLR
jgi:hypothetical protein